MPFLEREATRRLASHQWRMAWTLGDMTSCREAAAVGVLLDPNCPQALLMSALTHERAGDVSAARRVYTSVARVGAVEAPYAWSAVAGLDLPELPLDASSLDEDVVPAPPEIGSREQVVSSSIYQRFSHLWTIGPVDSLTLNSLPWWARQCLNAFEVLVAEDDCTTTSRYYQATATSGIRGALVDTAGPGFLPMPVDSWGLTFASLSGTSDRVEVLESRISEAASVSTASLSRIARVLCYLGFPGDARALLYDTVSSGIADGENALAVDTYLFARSLLALDQDFLDESARFYLRVPDDPLQARPKLATAIRALGIAGRLRNLPEAQLWRSRVLDAFGKYGRIPWIESSELALMESRVWRAACFVPVLEGDFDRAKVEVSRYVSIARAVAGESEIHFENMYATLETEGRFLQLRNDAGAACERFEELTEFVDPLDTKAWVNLGDAYEQRGDLQQAASTFRYAATLGPPLNDVALFRAGQSFRSLGKLRDAVESYIGSIRISPLAATPLVELVELGEELRWPWLRSWAEARLGVLSSVCET